MIVIYIYENKYKVVFPIALVALRYYQVQLSEAKYFPTEKQILRILLSNISKKYASKEGSVAQCRPICRSEDLHLEWLNFNLSTSVLGLSSRHGPRLSRRKSR